MLAIDGSPTSGGRTYAVLRSVLRGAAAAGASGDLVSLAGTVEEAVGNALDAIANAEIFVFGSPVYRATYATPLKALLDRLPRGMWGETEQPITARAVGIVMTGASWHHYLALGDLRNVLAGFYAAHVLSPGLYVPADGFSERALQTPYDELARAQGAALVDLAASIAASEALSAVRPQA